MEQLYAVYNDHDAGAAAALYLSEGRHEEIPQGRIAEGRAAIEAGLERFFQAFPDARWEAKAVIAAGDEAAVTYVLTGSLQSQLGPFAPRGQRLELRGVHVIRAPGGMIEVSQDYWDAATFGRQMAA